MGLAVLGSGQRYRPAELLSEDSLGTLWKGTDGWSGTPVVVRLVHERLTSDARALHRAATQLTAVRLRVSSPHVATVLDHELARPREQPAFVVFEGTGESLARRLERRAALPVEEALGVVAAVADGLATAHAAWIYHSALTPASVLVSNGAARVIDLGLGELLEGRERPARLGSPASLRDRGPADVRALGLLFEQLLLGRVERAAPHESDAPRAWEGRLPRDAAVSLRRALSPYRLQRPSMAELAAALAPSLSEVRARGSVLVLPPAPPRPEPVAPAPTERTLPSPPRRIAETPGRPRDASSRPAGGASEARAPRPGRRRIVLVGAVAAGALVLGGAAIGGYLVLSGPQAPVEDRIQGSTGAPSPNGLPVERATVPSVLGRSVELAIERIESAGLVAGRVTPVPGTDGVVVRTDPTPGEALAAGAVVDLFVGNGVQT
jgi:serine/threonine-protein kinase